MNFADPSGFCSDPENQGTANDPLIRDYTNGVGWWIPHARAAARDGNKATQETNCILDTVGGMGAGAMGGGGGGAGESGGGGGAARDAGEASGEGGAGSDTITIGKLRDLNNLPEGERTLDLPDMGSPQANWQQNAGRLREAMSAGRPIRDASLDRFGELTDNTGFLRAERNLLSDHGWVFDHSTGYWIPGG